MALNGYIASLTISIVGIDELPTEDDSLSSLLGIIGYHKTTIYHL